MSGLRAVGSNNQAGSALGEIVFSLVGGVNTAKDIGAVLQRGDIHLLVLVGNLGIPHTNVEGGAIGVHSHVDGLVGIVIVELIAILLSVHRHELPRLVLCGVVGGEYEFGIVGVAVFFRHQHLAHGAGDGDFVGLIGLWHGHPRVHLLKYIMSGVGGLAGRALEAHLTATALAHGVGGGDVIGLVVAGAAKGVDTLLAAHGCEDNVLIGVVDTVFPQQDVGLCVLIITKIKVYSLIGIGVQKLECVCLAADGVECPKLTAVVGVGQEDKRRVVGVLGAARREHARGIALASHQIHLAVLGRYSPMAVCARA